MKLTLCVVSILLTVVAVTHAQAPAPATTSTSAGLCSASPAMVAPTSGPHWNGWGVAPANTRFQPAGQAGLTAADLPKLKLKWAFGFANAMRARSQATVAGGRLFVANETGAVVSLDPKTGCTYWTFQAQGDVRTAISVGARTGGGYAVYFADGKSNAYALDATTGKQLWVRKVEENASSRITGAPALYENRLYVPTTGVAEENAAARPDYECCTFRGSVSALDVATGEVIWKTYTIADEPKPRGKSTTGKQLWGPAGGGVWSSPTIDSKRGLIYVSTGNGYSDPPQPTTDAVIALELQTGKVRWMNQLTPNDVWALGCGPNKNPNCPESVGPDFDFSASPMLATLANGRDLIVIPQKSGVGYALDPDKSGALVWQYRFGRGSGIGGVWGGATDQQQAYFSVADQRQPAPGGLHAVNLETGQRVWFTPPRPPLCGTGSGCGPAQSAAVSVIPGVVFSGSADGGMRAYSTKDGAVLWEFDTNRSFETVNGVKANGGSMDLAGAVISGGMLYFTAGNGGLVGRPGNVLLAFGLD
jgi:polyvinyl alcohol dehydrogenase (cytochrome)